ncbi:hypothetical protein Hte_004681 [Hypoxylon texense]
MDRSLIKVYSHPGGAGDHWADPRQIHLHEKTPSGTTKCSSSNFIAGGIVWDPNGAVFFMTTDRFIPSNQDDLEQHTDTSDGTCAYVGHVKHTSRTPSYYCLITINDSVADSRAIAESRDRFLALPLDGPRGACWSREVIEGRNEIKWGERRTVDQAERRAPHVMHVRYLPEISAGGWTLLGMWVYARRGRGRGSSSSSNDAATNPKLDRRGNGPYGPEISRYCPVDTASGASTHSSSSLVLIGHTAHSEYPDRWFDGMPVQVEIQGLYEVLMEIQARGDQLNDPRGVKA